MVIILLRYSIYIAMCEFPLLDNALPQIPDSIVPMEASIPSMLRDGYLLVTLRSDSTEACSS